ncbi:MAG TPA: hypothetical protein VLL48_05765, partial [Longimicrobiales bacterium]|nr:hypothetical protein [Longimicrobiales bacterium]
MSYDAHWAEWHLTPRGWELGSTSASNGEGDDDPGQIPTDRVKTCRYQQVASSSSVRVWVDDTWVADFRRAGRLEALHGDCPRQLLLG